MTKRREEPRRIISPIYLYGAATLTTARGCRDDASYVFAAYSA